MAKFRGKFFKKKGIVISKKERADGFSAKNTAEFAEVAAPDILKNGSNLKTASPSLRHALKEEIKRIDSDS
tara:strand:+ start:311 stop:523 length:213 start_codon:yes stop_codon:yes gene_type:complete